MGVCVLYSENFAGSREGYCDRDVTLHFPDNMVRHGSELPHGKTLVVKCPGLWTVQGLVGIHQTAKVSCENGKFLFDGEPESADCVARDKLPGESWAHACARRCQEMGYCCNDI